MPYTMLLTLITAASTHIDSSWDNHNLKILICTFLNGSQRVDRKKMLVDKFEG